MRTAGSPGVSRAFSLSRPASPSSRLSSATRAAHAAASAVRPSSFERREPERVPVAVPRGELRRRREYRLGLADLLEPEQQPPAIDEHLGRFRVVEGDRIELLQRRGHVPRVGEGAAQTDSRGGVGAKLRWRSSIVGDRLAGVAVIVQPVGEGGVCGRVIRGGRDRAAQVVIPGVRRRNRSATAARSTGAGMWVGSRSSNRVRRRSRPAMRCAVAYPFARALRECHFPRRGVVPRRPASCPRRRRNRPAGCRAASTPGGSRRSRRPRASRTPRGAARRRRTRRFGGRPGRREECPRVVRIPLRATRPTIGSAACGSWRRRAASAASSSSFAVDPPRCQNHTPTPAARIRRTATVRLRVTG